jgi:hypothetical protein
MMHAKNRRRCAVVLTLGVALAAQCAVPAFAQSVADSYTAACIDARAQTVAMKEYAVVLLANTIQADGPDRVFARAALLFKPASKLKRDFYPLVFDQPALVQCKDPLEPRDTTALPIVVMEIPGPDGSAADLVKRLKALSEDSGVVRREKTLPSWPLFLQFSRNAFQPVASGTAADKLMENYFKATPDAAFLADVPYKVVVSADFVGRITHIGITPGPAPAIGGPQAEDLRPTVQQQPQQQVPSQQVPQQQAQSAKGMSKGGRQNGTAAPPVAPGPSVASRPVNLTPTDVKFRFRANHDQWQALLQRIPDLIETFKFCAAPSSLGGGAYKMECTLRSDRKVPIRIRGFKELLIDPDGAVLDDLLQVNGYSVAYPIEWKLPQSEFVTVPSGPLQNVLKQRIALSQGVAGCQAEIAGLSIDNIVAGDLHFPAEPCKPFDIGFSQITLSPGARITKGCMAGSGDSVSITNGRVTCWARGGQTGELSLEAQLLDGFGAVSLRVASGNDVEFKFADLAGGLVPLWPYAPGIVEPGEAPVYVPRTIQFTSDSGPPCGRPLDPTPNGQIMLPSLEKAGCRQVPRTMVLTLEQDGGSQTGSPVPPQAFRPKVEDAIELATAQPGVRQIPLDQLKLPMGVQFSAEAAKTFTKQFGSESGNSQFSGVFLFQGACNGRRNGAFVPFNGPFTIPAAIGPYKWPIKAAVYDAGEEPLTHCATAVVRGTPGAQYLTFDLHGARALGPRRAIVISMSPNLVNYGGSAAVSQALKTFIDQISAEVARGAPLAPINVFLVNGEGEFKSLFTGEAAAFEAAKVKSQVEQTRETVVAATPDFRLLRLSPELRKEGAENFDRVTIVMDGSAVSPENIDVLAGLTNRLRNPESVNLLITSNCNTWTQQNSNLRCAQLPQDAGKRAELMVGVFSKFITPADAQAANLPTEEQLPSRQNPQTGPQPRSNPGGTRKQ